MASRAGRQIEIAQQRDPVMVGIADAAAGFDLLPVRHFQDSPNHARA
jgi:hypothetical protein